jgi:OPT family oligopeptide transporter
MREGKQQSQEQRRTELTDEEIRTWTLEQKDRFWLEHVYRGDEPQLTLRSGLTGMFLGGALSLTNLYVGAKTGWTLGVGITSVILAYAMFRALARVGLARHFTLLENNAMQSIATAAGYMTSPMISSLGAYMMVTGTVIPMATTAVWIIAIALLGVLYAFPLKRRFINDEQLPFPEGRAAGVVMAALHAGDAAASLFKAHILLATSAVAALVKVAQSEAIMKKLRLGLLSVPEFLDDWVYRFTTLRVQGIDLRELTVRPDTDFVMMAAGGLMGIRTGASLMLGAALNYLVLAPWAINHGDVHGKLVKGVMHYGFRPITMWALWGGVASMTAASLYSFFSKPGIVTSAIRGVFGRRDEKHQSDVLSDIELPPRVFIFGIPLLGGVVVALAALFFDVKVWMGVLAIPLIFVFTLIGVNSTGLTSITPIGALGKLTQLTFGVLAPGNITTNLMTAGIAGEVAGNAANLLMDIKPGYMLGGKPRHQALGHVLGIFAGALVSVPVFYAVFLRQGPQNLVSEQYPMPSATIWRAVAQVLTSGLSNLEVSARWLAAAGIVVGLGLEVLRSATRGRSWLSGVGLGLAFVIPFNTCLAMALGSLFFYLAERCFKDETSLRHRIFVQNLEPTAAGIIAGGALTGIAVVLVENFVL